MRLKSIEVSGFKSFARKTPLSFDASITAVVEPIAPTDLRNLSSVRVV